MTGAFVVHPSRRPLVGTVQLDGGKHSFAQTLAAAALAAGGVLRGCPDNEDVAALVESLRLIFDDVRWHKNELTFGTPINGARVDLTPDLTARSRSIFSLLPALLHHSREVRLAAPPTGCKIGDRPWDWYIKILTLFGVEVDQDSTGLLLRWRRRRPVNVRLSYPTMTGTVIALAAASATPGQSRLSNLSVEPTITDQVACLRDLGSVVHGALPELVVHGIREPRPTKRVIGPDRIHAATYLTAGLLTGGDVAVASAQGPIRIPQFNRFVADLGAEQEIQADRIRVRSPEGRVPLRAVNVLRCGSEPKFSSDWACLAALLLATRTLGESTLTDDVFLQRFQFLKVLGELGFGMGRTTVEGREAVQLTIRGSASLPLRARTLVAPDDIRGSVSLVLAGLVADGRWAVLDGRQVRRGHADLAKDLRSLGADVEYEEMT